MYLQIQKMRFGKRLDWKVHCPEQCMTVKIPMLSIQPLVENACKYGIEPKIKGGFINISIEMSEVEFSIHVQDNGMGISENTIVQFNRWKRDGTDPETLGIGILNTYQRVKHFYGDQSDLIIKSSSAGTLCSINIRKENLYESAFGG
jgi:sensor histidine kinase YesM